MKKKYISPKLNVQIIKIEEPIANGQPDIENQSIEEEEWEVEF